MTAGLFLTGLQIATSIARLSAFSLAVLTMGRIGRDGHILLAIGYLPFLAFFDILVQSGSRAVHLGGGRGSNRQRFRIVYAVVALSALITTFVVSLWHPSFRAAFILSAWPLGAIGFVWERSIAIRGRQLLLSMTELTLIAASISTYSLGGLSWPVLLFCVVSFPMARLIVLTLPIRLATLKTIADASAPPAASGANWGRISGYVGASLAQQFIAAIAASLPAIYAQATGDWRTLPVNVAFFRALHSLAAIVSMTINSMSSRIFYRQGATGTEALEVKILAAPKRIVAVALLVAGAAAVMALGVPYKPAGYSFTILPLMAAVNAESSMLYNRGLPIGTMHCQFLILLLSLSFLAVLVKHNLLALLALAGFSLYVLIVVPALLRMHRHALVQDRKA